jgi:hypothetical protein
MNARNTAVRRLVGLVVVALLAGCAPGASTTPLPASPTATNMPSAAVAPPTPTSTPTATPAPLAYGPVTVVTGTATCPTGDLGNPTTDAKGVTHFRGGGFICTMKIDDPRVSGTHTTTTYNMDWWGKADLSSGALVQWAAVRLENAGGAWEGKLSGVFSSDRGDRIVIWYKGTGGYGGLSYFELWTGVRAGVDLYSIQGQIFPGDPPTP